MFENALACHLSDFSFSVYQSFTLRAYCFVPFFWSGYPGLVSGQHASKNKVFVKKVLFSWRSCGQLVKHWTVMPEAFHSRPAGLNIYFLYPHPYSTLGNSGCTPCLDPVLSCLTFSLTSYLVFVTVLWVFCPWK